MEEDYFDEDSNDDLDDKEKERLIERFEKMINNDSIAYFDSDDYAIVFDHYFYTGKINKAQKALSLALKQFPDSQELKLKKVHYFLYLEKNEEALKLLIETDNESFSDVETLLEQAYLYAQLRSFDKSLAKYQQLIEIENQDEEYIEDVYLGISDVYDQMGDTKKSLYYLQQALEIDPENEFLLSNVVEVFYELGDEDEKYEVIDYLIKFTNKYPLFTAAWSYLGLVYTEVGLLEKAVEAFDNALALDDNNEEALSYQMNTFFKLNERKKANEAFYALLQISQFKELAWYQLADNLSKIEDYSSALFAFQKSIDENPRFSLSFVGKAMVYAQMEQFNNAIKNLQKALDIDANNFEYWLLLGEYLCDADRDDDAKMVYEHLAKHFPKESDTWLSYSDFYAFKKNDINNAIDILFKGIEIQLDNIAYLYRMANYFFLKKDVLQGTSYLQLAYVSKPDMLNDFFEYDETMYDIPEVIDFVTNINNNIE